jgi:hypothetical protein
MALEQRTLLTVRKRMKPWPTFSLKAFRHSAQASPGQSLPNNALQPNALVGQTEFDCHPVVLWLSLIRKVAFKYSKHHENIMNEESAARVRPRSRLAFLAMFAGTLVWAVRLYAPPVPPVLSISGPVSNSVTVTVVSGEAYNYALQMSTNLSTTNWINIQSNYVVPTPITFTNIPATNNTEYFRMVSLPPLS